MLFYMVNSMKKRNTKLYSLKEYRRSVGAVDDELHHQVGGALAVQVRLHLRQALAGAGEDLCCRNLIIHMVFNSVWEKSLIRIR